MTLCSQWAWAKVGGSGCRWTPLSVPLLDVANTKSLCTISIQFPPAPTSPKSAAPQTGFMVTEQLRMTLNFCYSLLLSPGVLGLQGSTTMPG